MTDAQIISGVCDARIAAANEIIAQQNTALASAYGALRLAKEAITYGFLEGYSGEGSQQTVSDAINEAIAEIIGKYRA